MEFFDKKEEVFDIQLTQYGKHLLSLGKFKPTEYAFFDNDIIYDFAYASGSEQQNKTEERIKEVPRIKTQYVYSGIETQVKKLNKLVKQGHLYGDTDEETAGVQFGKIGDAVLKKTLTDVQVMNAETNYSLMLPMGNSALSNKYAPAWDIKFLHSSASVFTDHITGSHFKLLKIPQGEIQITYKTYITNVDESGMPSPDYLRESEQLLFPAAGDQTGDKIFESVFLKQYGEDTTIQVEKDYVFLDVLEENVDFKKENFDIEVFRIHESGDEEKLHFLQDYQIGTLETNDSRERYVEWWFNIFVDNEIDPTIFCKTNQEDRRKNVFADQFGTFNCEDEEKEFILENIYDVELTDEDYEEPC